MHDFDMVIRGGTLVDGSGSPRRRADVACADGLVREVGEVSGSGRQEVDAGGAVVMPGFVDVHTHYDGQATWSEELSPSSWHGVTTVVAGNCGVGFAPVRPTDHDQLIELMEGVEDIPGAALHEGLTWGWESFPEFLDVLERRRFDIDIATQVPHSALRLFVMGERGARREPATEEDIALMAGLAADAVTAGALGFTTSRTRNHRTSRGEWVPTLEAEARELVGIATAVGATGTGVLQVVSDFEHPGAEFEMLSEMARRSGRPLSVSLLQTGTPDGWRTIMRWIEDANADGLAVKAQVAARPVGILLGLETSLTPFMGDPVFAEVAGRPHQEIVDALRDPAFRHRLVASAQSGSGRRPPMLADPAKLYELGERPDYEPDDGASVAGRAARSGTSPEEVVVDLLLADDGHGLVYYPFANYLEGHLDAVGEMLRHDHTIPGLSDGGAHVGTICDNSFPTTLLAHWGRDRPDGIPLEFLVRRQCKDTASALGLGDRGVVAPGYRADLNVVDHEVLAATKPHLVHDLPAGGRRFVQGAVGYRHTYVAGTEIARDGVPTGARPGRLVRGAR